MSERDELYRAELKAAGWPVPVGSVIRYKPNPNPDFHRVLHVRGEVDGVPIVREWSKRYQCWVYKELEHSWFFACRKSLDIEAPPAETDAEKAAEYIREHGLLDTVSEMHDGGAPLVRKHIDSPEVQRAIDEAPDRAEAMALVWAWWCA